MNNDQKLRDGQVFSTLIGLAIPSIIAMIISAVYNFVDTMFVGLLHDTAALSAVSIAFPLVMLIAAFGQMIGAGSANYISRNLGAKNYEEASKASTKAIFSGIIVAIIVTIFGTIFLDQSLVLLGARGDVLPKAHIYSIWLVLGAIFSILNMTMNNIIRAEGAAKFSMVALIIGAVVNIILDPIFMFTFNLGIAGASIATVLAQAISTLYLFSYFRSKRGLVIVKKQYFNINFKQDTPLLKEIAIIGIPNFLMQALTSLSFGLLNSMASEFGAAAVAAIGVANRIYSIPMYIMFGFLMGFQPFAAFNFGAKQYGRVRKALIICLSIAVSVGLLSAVGVYIFSEPLVGLFTQDPEVLGLGQNFLIAQGSTYYLFGVIMLFSLYFQTIGSGFKAGFLNLARQGLFFIPLVIALPQVFEKLNYTFPLFNYDMEPGLAGLALAQPVSDFITFIVVVPMAILAYHKLVKLEKTNK